MSRKFISLTVTFVFPVFVATYYHLCAARLGADELEPMQSADLGKLQVTRIDYSAPARQIVVAGLVTQNEVSAGLLQFYDSSFAQMKPELHFDSVEGIGAVFSGDGNFLLIVTIKEGNIDRFTISVYNRELINEVLVGSYVISEMEQPLLWCGTIDSAPVVGILSNVTGQLRFESIPARKEIVSIDLRSQAPQFAPIVASDDLRFVAWGGHRFVKDRFQLTVWHSEWSEVKEVIDANRRGVTALAFAPDAAVVAVADSDGAVAIWKMGTDGMTLQRALSPSRRDASHRVSQLVFSPNGKRLAAQMGRDLLIWNAELEVSPKPDIGPAGEVAGITWISNTELVTGRINDRTSGSQVQKWRLP